MRLHIVLFPLGAWCLQRQAELPEGTISIERHRATYRRYWLEAPQAESSVLEAQLDGM